MKRLFLLEDDLSLISGLSFAVKKQGYEMVTVHELAKRNGIQLGTGTTYSDLKKLDSNLV